MQSHLSAVAAYDPFMQNEDNEAELQKLRQVVVHLTKLSAIGTTAAMIVHEVAQPVTAATNYLAAAQRLLTEQKPKTEELALEAVELAQECLLRTAEIMRNVKEAAATKAFQARSLDLHTVVADIVKLYSETWGLTPRVTLSTSACRVLGDPIQLAQVLSNLIRNAMEATEGQSERSLSVCSRLADDGMVEIRVEDNGPGIAPQIREKLFSPFSSTKPEGMGVGLSICRAIVEQHQGRIWAETLANGTALCFTLPADRGLSKQRMSGGTQVVGQL
jgi:two-component system sensor kinase FixL